MIRKTSRSKLVSTLIHVLIWLVFGLVFFIYQPLTLSLTLPIQFWINQCIIFSLLVGVYYLNSRYLVPQFLIKNKIRPYILLVLAVIVIAVLISSITDTVFHIHQILERASHQQSQQQGQQQHNRFNFEILMTILISFIFAISTSIASTQNWQKDLQLRQALEQDKISSELSFLKAQINPHFFFNTLNNIYALTLINVEDSRIALHQLSRMMRYLLYETQQGSTLLSKEIAFIKDYISLMQLRLTNLTTITFDIPPQIKDMTIAPMLFLPFVENAFKHGISATKSGKIIISIKQNENLLELLVKNNIFKDQAVLADENKGIGLPNTIRRLDLLYPEKYSLNIEQQTEHQEYIVHLKIDLK